MKQAAASVGFQRTARRYIPEDRTLEEGDECTNHFLEWMISGRIIVS
jgi:hypothetical protein